MEHKLIIVVILTIGFALASFFGYMAQKIRLPPMLGYLLAGFIIGPYSPGFVADISIAEQLAEIGIILMLFGVGMHFKIRDLMNVTTIAIPGAVVQISAATLASIAIVVACGWSLENGVIVGLSVGVASTVVLVRLLSENHIVNTLEGHVAIGWLIVEDIFTVLVLVLLPAFGQFMQGTSTTMVSDIFIALFIALGKFLLLLVFVFTLGDKITSFVLTTIARTRSQELFTATVLAVILTIAAAAAFIFGASIALGAFIAGMIIARTKVKYQAQANALPLRDVFTIIFFLSVGMLFNPGAIYSHFLLFLGILFVVLVIKPIVALIVTLLLGHSLRLGVVVAIALAQVGEFSFILSEEAMKFDLLPDEGFDLIVACALISISLNSMLYKASDFFTKGLGKLLNVQPSSTTNIADEIEDSGLNAVIVGYGPIGKEIASIVKSYGIQVKIIEHNIDTVIQSEFDNRIIFGDASEVDILSEAKVPTAEYLIIAIPNSSKSLEIIHAGRQLNPNVRIFAYAQYISEIESFKEEKVKFFCAEKEALHAFSNLLHEALRKPIIEH